MSQPEISIYPVRGLPEIAPGERLHSLVCSALREGRLNLCSGDILVVGHKVISKAEGKIVRLDDVDPSRRASEWAASWGRDARVIELALREARSVLRMENGILITETRHGFVCANSGVDTSNVPPGFAVTLPDDPDASAERLRAELGAAFQAEIAVIVSDTFGRPWREGLVNVAIGVAGFNPVLDYRGSLDSFGKTLRVSMIATADELAGAAELVMGKAKGIPVVLIRGVQWTSSDKNARELLRPEKNDLFR